MISSDVSFGERDFVSGDCSPATTDDACAMNSLQEKGKTHQIDGSFLQTLLEREV